MRLLSNASIIFRYFFLLTLGASTQAEEAIYYNRDVLPILSEHCFSCHGADKATREAELRLDMPESAYAARNGRRAISPKDLSASELWTRVQSDNDTLRMPPLEANHQLTSQEKQILAKWIQQGAKYAGHWAYQSIEIAPLPSQHDANTPIDCFIVARLEQEGLSLSEAASPSTLLRRISLDLTGLPPTPEQILSFTQYPSANAYERLIDQLLASPQFGERWGRWWLDLSHYADSDGYLQDFIRPNAWRYRQWVVESLNSDLPFDQFTIEQIAGDLLPNAMVSQRIATGFLRNTLSNREGGADLEEYRIRQVVDRTNTVATTWLALTIACAECHDHKFDNLSQADFYQLFAYFNNSDEANIDAPLPGELEPYRQAESEYLEKRKMLLEPLAKDLETLQQAWEDKIVFTETNPGVDHRWDRQLEILGLIWGQGLGEGQLEGLNLIKTPPTQRSEKDQRRLTDYFLKHGSLIDPDSFTKHNLPQISNELEKLASTLPSISRAPTMTRAVVARDTYIHQRGDFRRPGRAVKPSIPLLFRSSQTAIDSTRLDLAKWIASPSNPLTARVLVNRLWQELFGIGIVRTSENFGVRGELPFHPELLDWLAHDFINHGWSIKHTIKQIVLSKTYQQSSIFINKNSVIDPLNRLVSRQARLRLSGETIRDVGLFSSGLLSKKMGGPSVRPFQPDSVSMEGFDNKWITSEGADRYRRGLYTFIQRTSPFAQLVTFDFPDSSRSCTRRERSNTPLQALNLLNDPVFIEMAGNLARRLLIDPQMSDSERLSSAFLSVIGRLPSPIETQQSLALLEKVKLDLRSHKSVNDAEGRTSQSPRDVEQSAWTIVASVLLNLDEFLTRE
ncbi:MAG: hypothetical protein RLY14_2682 [Planctomycetota bacterium]|jgi:hypothetical protein